MLNETFVHIDGHNVRVPQPPMELRELKSDYVKLSSTMKDNIIFWIQSLSPYDKHLLTLLLGVTTYESKRFLDYG